LSDYDNSSPIDLLAIGPFVVRRGIIYGQDV
jgi:hypothetical protein